MTNDELHYLREAARVLREEDVRLYGAAADRILILVAMYENGLITNRELLSLVLDAAATGLLDGGGLEALA